MYAGTVFGAAGLSLAALAVSPASAQSACARPPEGSTVAQPTDLYSSNGTLSVALNYFQSVDSLGRQTFCFQTADGSEGPTLHVNPGDTLSIALKNETNAKAQMPPMNMTMEMTKGGGTRCGAADPRGYPVNMHFHGANLPPTCHQDEVIRTTINPGSTFTYTTKFPTDEPSGLYWYHPHIHGLSNINVLGGATGAIIVDGIQNVAPEVANLPARTLIMRDQNVMNAGTNPPSWDVSLNYVPIDFPNYTPAVIQMKQGAREFWRFANTSADTIADIAVVYDGVAQPLKVVAQDAVALGSQDGTQRGHTQTVTDMLVPPGGRVEFIVDGPKAGVQSAQLITKAIDGGPAGDVDPTRPLATIQTTSNTRALPRLPVIPAVTAPPQPARFAGLETERVTAHRKLYFYEIAGSAQQPPKGGRRPPWARGLFYIVVDGQQPQVFNPNAPPAITTRQGAVEDWTIENRTGEVHEFHIHQIHFQMRRLNGTLVAPVERKILDTVNVPYWSGTGPYPSVTLRMDFRGRTVGDFVYHCHILGHEDSGMMAIIRVKPRHRNS